VLPRFSDSPFLRFFFPTGYHVPRNTHLAKEHLMDLTQIDHEHREQRKPRHFYHTPFSYIAFWLALMTIAPMSGRITPVPDVRADGARRTNAL
jgi:hypothetical protein